MVTPSPPLPDFSLKRLTISPGFLSLSPGLSAQRGHILALVLKPGGGGKVTFVPTHCVPALTRGGNRLMGPACPGRGLQGRETEQQLEAC